MRERRTLRARIVSFLYRVFTKRRPARGREAFARQSRRIMGLPRPLRFAWGLRPGIRIDQRECGGVRCERVRWRTSYVQSPQHPPRAILLYFHGGGYICCSPQTHRPNTITLARLLEAEVMVPDYRLAPEHPFPAGLDDAFNVYRALCQTTSAKQIVFAGDSAGGGLAIATALRAREERLDLPAAILTFSPWVDLTLGREAELRPREQLDDMFYAESFAAYSDAYLQGIDPRTPFASPLFAQLDNLPPLLVEVSSTEMLCLEARQICKRWADAGNLVELNVSLGVPHGWQEVTPCLPEARESLRRAADFAKRQLPTARA